MTAYWKAHQTRSLVGIDSESLGDRLAIIDLENVTPEELVQFPATHAALLPEFRAEHAELLQDLLGKAYALCAARHMERASAPDQRALSAWIVPVVFVVGEYADLGAATIGRITAAGATFVERADWPSVSEELAAFD